MSEEKKLPTLVDEEISTSSLVSKKATSIVRGVVSVSLALSMTGFATSCSDAYDCDYDVSSTADPVADPADFDPSDSVDADATDADTSTVGDTRCD